MLKKVLENGVRLFLIDDVSPEDMAMLMALYARSGESVETQVGKVYAERHKALAQVFEGFCFDDPPDGGMQGMPEGMADAAMQIWSDNHPTVRATRLHEKYVAGYGHKSIADNGTTALFVEGGSMILAKALEDTPLFNGQEMSSRAVDCGNAVYVDPIGSDESRLLLERWRSLYQRMLPIAATEARRRHPRREDEEAETYERAIAMRAFDVCRGFLPFGCSTQTGWSGTLRHIGDRLAFLRQHPLPEVRLVAEGLLELCQARYPSSGFDVVGVASGVGRAGDSEVQRLERENWTARAARNFSYPRSSRMAGDRLQFWAELDEAALAALPADLLRTRPRGALLPWFTAGLGLFHAEFLLDMGSWRDLQRHRAMVVKPALLTADEGFESWYIGQLPPRDSEEAIAIAVELAARAWLLTTDPVLRQYYLGMGYRVCASVSASLPALVYFLELRSGKTIHPTLRRRVLEMVSSFRKHYPLIALHADEDPDDWTARRGAQTIKERRP